MTFASKLVYDKNKGFGTASLALPLKLSEVSKTSKTGLVDSIHENWNQLMEIFKDWAVVLKYRKERQF